MHAWIVPCPAPARVLTLRACVHVSSRRTRRQIKNKFKTEDRNNRQEVNEALNYRHSNNSADNYREMIAMLQVAQQPQGAAEGSTASRAPAGGDATLGLPAAPSNA